MLIKSILEAMTAGERGLEWAKPADYDDPEEEEDD